MSHVTLTPVDDYTTPVAAVIVAPAPVDEHISPATIEDAAPAPVPVMSAAHVPVDECRCGTSIHG